MYKLLAQNSFTPFGEHFSFPNSVYAVPIDDHVRSGYSHTAILAKALTSTHIKPLYQALRASHHVNYSGKSLEYRLLHPRGFIYTSKPQRDIILIDDIVTSATTINEAKNSVTKGGANPLFALTLADAREP